MGSLLTGGTRAARLFAIAGLIGLVALALITIADVLMRWLLNSPMDGVADLGRLMVAVVISTFFPLALAERHHISITFLGKALGRRGHAWLEVFAALVTTVFFTLLSWQLYLFTEEMFESGETTWILALPVAPCWTAATVFMITCVPIQIAVLIQTYHIAMAGGEDLAAKAPGH